MNTNNYNNSLADETVETKKIDGYEVTGESFKGMYPTEIAEIKPLLNHVDNLNEKLQALKARIHPESDLWQVILQKMRAEWTYHSNAIEGSTLSQGDTIFFLQEGLTVEGKPFKDFLDAKNHAEAIDILFDVVANNRDVSEFLIKEINALLLNGVRFPPAQTPTGQEKVCMQVNIKNSNHVIKQDINPTGIEKDFFYT